MIKLYNIKVTVCFVLLVGFDIIWLVTNYNIVTVSLVSVIKVTWLVCLI